MSGFHFPSTDREERLGKLKFDADWEGPQTKADLECLSWFREYSDVWGAPKEYNIPRESIEKWIYCGPAEKYQKATNARDRAFKRRHQLEVVRRMIGLLKRCGLKPDPNSLELLDLADDDRALLAEARRLIHGQSEDATAEPKMSLTDTDSDQKPVVRKSKRKRGPKPEISNRVKSEMNADIREKRLTAAELYDMREKDMVYRYRAVRDTCRKARVEVLKKIKRVRKSSRATTAKRRNSDK